MTSDFLRWLVGLIRSGDVHPFYISTEWRKARAGAIKYYHGECQRCKHEKVPSVLTPATMVHHVKSVKKYPQFALSLFVFNSETGEKEAQLLPLCDACHAAVESKSAKAQESYPERW